MSNAMLERMRAEADAMCAASDLPLAPEPTNFFFEGTHRLNDDNLVQLNARGMARFLVGQGVSEEHVSSLAVSAVAGQIDSHGTQATVHNSPRVINDQVHYPCIELRLTDRVLKHPGYLNFLARHELAHIVYGDADMIYENRRVQRAAQAAGVLSMLALSKIGFDQISSFSMDYQHANNLMATLALLVAAGIAVKNPVGFLNTLHPKEVRASIFALRHTGFRPISVNS